MNSFKTIVTFGSLVTLLSIGIPLFNSVGIAQNPPAKTYQPGPWQPVARVNPEATIQVNIINRAGVGLEYSLTTEEMNIRKIAAGQTGKLTDLPKDTYILINPQTSQVSLKFNIQVTEDNIVNIRVRQSADPSGESTVNIQSNGGIYQY
ncbi:MAG: hypothetical protein WBA77_10205 [Microcoleaceae cyanobacterium]